MGIVKTYSRIKPEFIISIIGLTDKTIIAESLNQASEHFDLDKSWEALHFLITGEKAYFGDHEFSMLLLPPNDTIGISEEEYDFYWDNFNATDVKDRSRWNEIENKINGNVGYLNHNDIKRLGAVITALDMNHLLKQTNLEILNKNYVYPENWANSIRSKEYIKFHFDALDKFVRRANDANEFIVIY